MKFVKKWLSEAIAENIEELIVNTHTLNGTVKEIQMQIEENGKVKRWKWQRSDIINAVTAGAAIIAVILSWLAFGFSNDTFKEQQKTQSYTYWQGFLALTVEHPAMANGLDCIDGFSIGEIANRNEIGLGNIQDSTYKKYLQYAWFVANALNAGEIVYNLQKDDPYWRNTIKGVVGGHVAFYQSGKFNFSDYEPDFQVLIKEAMEDTK